KAEEKLLLTRFKHSDFSSKTIALNVPAVLAGENTSVWCYMDSVGDEHYLASKTRYPAFGKNDFQVVAFNAAVQVTRSMKFGITLKNKFARMSYVYWPQSASFEDIVNYDRTFASVTSTTPGAGPGGAGGMTTTSTRNYLTDVAFGNLLLDEKTKSFYAFGLL